EFQERPDHAKAMKKQRRKKKPHLESVDKPGKMRKLQVQPNRARGSTMAVSVTIQTIAGVATDPADISNNPTGPWNVSGQVSTTAGSIDSMSYSINNGPASNIVVPGGAAFSFNLTMLDIPANGSYLLAVYAYNTNSEANLDVKTIRQSGMIGGT